jgi:hypothetical protein
MHSPSVSVLGGTAAFQLALRKITIRRQASCDDPRTPIFHEIPVGQGTPLGG